MEMVGHERQAGGLAHSGGWDDLRARVGHRHVGFGRVGQMNRSAVAAR